MENLERFFTEERKRVFEPHPDFARRIVARLSISNNKIGFRETRLAMRAPVIGLATAVLIILTVLQFAPMEPTRGMVTPYFEAQSTPAERLLFSDPEFPSGEVLEEVMLLEN